MASAGTPVTLACTEPQTIQPAELSKLAGTVTAYNAFIASQASIRGDDLRKGKVLVDWSQNDRAKTTVAVYSLRARTRPTRPAGLHVERAVVRGLYPRVRRLREQILTLSHRVQRMASLTAENVRLRELLSAASRNDVPFITAELLSLDADPFSHQMVIDRGRRNGAYVGQPVMDASGLVGQVTAVSAYSSRVLLLADASHALPVQVNRNGLRFIVQGSGNYNALNVLHVPDTADIREGDLLLLEAMGGGFTWGSAVVRW